MSCCTSVPTNASPVQPTLLPNFACRFETSRFAEAMPREGTESNRDVLGSINELEES